MNSIISIELFEEHNKVNFYTLRFQNEETEIEKFFDKFPEGCEFDDGWTILEKEAHLKGISDPREKEKIMFGPFQLKHPR